MLKSISPTSDPALDPEFLGPEEFGQRLYFEEKRAGRSGMSFGVVLLETPTLLGSDGGRETRQRVTQAFCSTLRDTDIRGWYKQSATLGAIFTEIEAAEAHSIVNALVRQIENRLEGALSLEERQETKLTFSVYGSSGVLNSSYTQILK